MSDEKRAQHIWYGQASQKKNEMHDWMDLPLEEKDPAHARKGKVIAVRRNVPVHLRFVSTTPKAPQNHCRMFDLRPLVFCAVSISILLSKRN